MDKMVVTGRTDPLVDRDHVEKIAAQLGWDAVAELMGDVRAVVKEARQGIAGGLAEGTLEVVRAYAHRVKGSAGSFGLVRLHAAAKALEDAAAAGSVGTVLGLHEDFEQTLGVTLEALEDVLDRRG